MKFSKILATVFLTISFSILAGELKIPNFSEYNVQLSKGPFAKKINFTSEQQAKSHNWKKNYAKTTCRKSQLCGALSTLY